MPVLVLTQEEAVVPGVQRCAEKQAYHPEMSHLAETAVGRGDGAAHDAEAPALHLFAQHVVFREKRRFMEPSQLLKARPVKEHEHARAEGLTEQGKALHQVVAGIQKTVDE